MPDSSQPSAPSPFRKRRAKPLGTALTVAAVPVQSGRATVDLTVRAPHLPTLLFGYRLYETQDGWIQIAAVADRHFLAAFDQRTAARNIAQPRADDPSRRCFGGTRAKCFGVLR